MLLKYPRTRHLEGSRLHPGDEDLDSVAFAAIRGYHVVVEEKLDEANVGVGFDVDGALREAAGDAGLDPDRVVAETDSDDFMEGLYIKVEDGDETVGRYRWVRRSFLAAILDSGTHWASRPILPNRLAGGPRADL